LFVVESLESNKGIRVITSLSNTKVFVMEPLRGSLIGNMMQIKVSQDCFLSFVDAGINNKNATDNN